MLYLSEILIQNPGFDSFDELMLEIERKSKGEFHLKIDIKPNYGDTPADWEDRIEGAFSGIYSMMGPKIEKTEDDF